VLHEPDREEEREKAIEKLAAAAEIEGRDRHKHAPARGRGTTLAPPPQSHLSRMLRRAVDVAFGS
jgi:hypothetical protein